METKSRVMYVQRYKKESFHREARLRRLNNRVPNLREQSSCQGSYDHRSYERNLTLFSIEA